MKDCVLFSCVGTSDPVRGQHDGSMLHIIRHYKPHHVLLYISEEMSHLNEKDDRYRKALVSLKKHTGIHCEMMEPFLSKVTVDDFDVFSNDFLLCIGQIRAHFPDSVILLNLSSGTIQMKMSLCLLAADPKYPLLGIQVHNWENHSGTEQRTNDHSYDVDTELELNIDNEENSENRCSEPRIFSLQREFYKQQLRALIKRRSYQDTYELAKLENMSPNLLSLLKHAALRMKLDIQGARAAIKNIPLDFNLFPVQSVECIELTEYFLVLKNYVRNDEITNFVLRLNPFTIRIQELVLEKQLKFNAADFEINTGKTSSHKKISRSKILSTNPGLLSFLDSKYNNNFHDSEPNIQLYNYVMEYYTTQLHHNIPQEDTAFFTVCERINLLRNDAAHTFTYITDDEIFKDSKMRSSTIITRFQSLLKRIFGNSCPAEIFDIYDKIDQAILNMI